MHRKHPQDMHNTCTIHARYLVLSQYIHIIYRTWTGHEHRVHPQYIHNTSHFHNIYTEKNLYMTYTGHAHKTITGDA